VDGAAQNLPYLHQLLSYVATVAGAILSLIGMVAAIYAARKAKGAKDAAVDAQRSAIRLGRIAQIGDLIGDMQELESMIAREDFAAISQKCARLTGRIARYKQEAYTDLSEEGAQHLDEAGAQLESLGKIASVGVGKPENRWGRLRLGYQNANKSLNSVFGIVRTGTQG
jgi:hypothetical protein